MNPIEQLGEFHSIFDNAKEGIFHATLDGQLQKANPALAHIYGYESVDEIVANIKDISKQLHVHNETYKSFLNRLLKHGYIDGFEAQNYRKDGSVVWTLTNARIVRDEDGNGRYVEGFVTDITIRKEIETALKESEDKFQALIERIPAVVFLDLTNEHRKTIYVSPRIEDLLGYTPEEWLADFSIWEKSLHPDDRDRVLTSDRQTDDTGEPFQEEYRIQKKDSNFIWVREEASLVRDDQGHPLYWQGFITNITERKQAEASVLQSENQFKSMFQASPIAIAIATLDEGVFTDVNQAFEDLAGYSKEDLIGKSVLAFDFWRSRQERSNFVEKLRRERSLKELEWVFNSPEETERTTLAFYELFELDGTECVLAMFHDITEQEKAQKALRESEASYRGLFDSVTEGIYVQDKNGEFLAVNQGAAQMYGYPKDYFIGKTPEFFSAPGKNDLEIVGRALEKAFEGEPQQFEFWGVRKNGEIFPKAIRLSKGKYFGQDVVFALAHDITEQKQVEEALRDSERNFRNIIEHTTNIYYSHTPDHILTFMSPQTREILGREPEEALVDWHEFLTDNPINQNGVALTQKAINSGQRQNPYVLELKHKSGKSVWVEVRESPILRDGKTVAIVGALTDITERIQAEEALQRQLAELTVLHNVVMAAALSNSIDEVIQRVTDIIGSTLYPDNCGVELLTDSGDMLIPHSSYRGAKQDKIRNPMPISQGVAGKTIRTGQPQRISDVLQEPVYVEITEGIKSEICVPIIVGNQIIGVINAESRRLDAFTESDERLLNTIAGNLGTAIERIRLFEAEQTQRLDAEALREGTTALTATLDMPSLLDAILVNLSRIISFDSASITMEKDGYIEIVAQKGLPSELEFIGLKLKEARKWNEIIDKNAAIIIPDAQADPSFEKVEGAEHIRGWMGVPMISQNKILGFVNLDSTRVNAFQERDAILAQTFANSAAIAIDNARLYQEALHATERRAILHHVSQDVAQFIQDPERTYEAIYQATQALMPCDAFVISTCEDGSQDILATYLIESGKRFPTRRVPSGQGLTGKIISTGESIILNDVLADGDQGYLHFGDEKRVRSVLAVPMRIGNKVIGMLSAQCYQPNTYKEEEQTLLEMLAAHAGAAIQNSRLLESERAQLALSQTLQEVGSILTTRMDLDEVVEQVFDLLSKVISYDSVSIQLLDNKEELNLIAGRGFSNIHTISNVTRRISKKVLERFKSSKAIVIPDTRKNHAWVVTEEGKHIRSWIGAPLLIKGTLIGILSIDNTTVNAYNETNAKTVMAFANQAAIAIENARLFASESEQRQRNEALLELMRVATSTMELDEVLQIILSHLTKLVPSNMGTIQLLEGNKVLVVATAGMPDGGTLLGKELPLDEYPLNKKLVEEKDPLYLPNVKNEPDFKLIPGINDQTLSFLAVPLVSKETIIGFVSLDSYELDHFSEQDIDLTITISKHAASIVENVRMFETEQRRLKESETLRRAGLAINTSLDLESVLDAILIVMKEVIPYDSASVMLEEGDKLRLAAAQGFSKPQNLLSHYLPAEDKLYQSIKETEQPLILEDAQQDSRFSHWGEADRIRGWLGIPLIVRGKMIGCITLDSHQPNTYDDDLLSLAQAFANQAATAIQNARAFETEQRHFQEAETLREAAESISSSLEIQEVLDTILNALQRVVPYDSASIFLIEDENTIRLTAARGLPRNGEAIGLTFSAKNALIQEIWNSGKPVILEDAQADLRFENWAAAEHVRGWMGIPLAARGAMIGCITLDSFKPDSYHEHDATLAITFAHQAAVAIENANLFKRSERQVRRLTVLREIDTAISSSFDLNITLNILINNSIKELDVDAAAILIYNSDVQSLTYFTGAGFKKYNIAHTQLRIGEGLASQVAMQRQAIHIKNLEEVPEYTRGALSKGENFIDYIGIPLLGKGQLKGVLELYKRTPIYTNPDWMNFIQTLAGQAAIAIDNVELFRNLQRTNQELSLAYDTTLEGWGKALELRDKETQGHTRRVAELTVKLARHMGMQGEELTHVLRGTLLHDIGKMGIPDSILNKTGPLSTEEWDIMRQHPQFAHDLMYSIPYLRSALEIPYGHHERWDGSGYPRGLKGTEIPLAARIFAVIDVWDALLYERPYRDAWPEEKVLAYLRDQAGKQLDPEIVHEFLHMLVDEKKRAS